MVLKYFQWIVLVGQILLPLLLFSQTTLSNVNSVDETVEWLQENLYIDSLRMQTLDLSKATLVRAYKEESQEKVAELHAYISAWYDFYNYNDEGLAQDSVIFHETKAMEIYEARGEDDKVATSYLNIALSYLNYEQFGKAEENILTAINYYEKNDYQKGLGIGNKYLCNLFLAMEDYEKAISYAIKSNEILENFEDKYGTICVNHFNMVRAYNAIGEYEQAIETANEGLKILEEKDMMDQTGILVRLISFRGNAYQKLKKYKEAEEDSKVAYQMVYDWVGDERSTSWREDIGNNLALQGKYEEALPHLEASIKAYEEVHNSASIYEPLTKLKDCYANLGDFKNAFLFSEKIRTERDSMYTNKIATLNEEGMLKYETGKKEAAIRNKDIQLEQQKKTQYLGIGFIILLLAFLSALYRSFRKNQKFSRELGRLNNDLKDRNEEKEVLLKEIHHRVKNNLQVISSLLNFQSRSIEDSQAKTAILDSQSRVKSMSLIHQRLYRGANLAAVDMKDYLSLLSESLIDAYSDEEMVVVKLNMDAIELDVDIAIPIGLIVNELITNSLKHAFPDGKKGAIEVNLFQEKEELILDISDNGMGKPSMLSGANGGGFGSELVDMLTLQLKGKLVEESVTGFQTQLRVPFKSVA